MGCTLSTVCTLGLALTQSTTTATTATTTATATVAAVVVPPPAPAPIIELITFAPGPDLYSFWGHAAIRVIAPNGKRDLIYNFGSVDFSGNFLLRLLRGRVDAYVSVGNAGRTFSAYRAEDRTIVRRRLAIGDDQARAIAKRLAGYVRGGRHEYRYHHFVDNCSTRVANEIDIAFDGALSAPAKKLTDETYRERSLALVRPYTALYVFIDILMTAPIDRPITRWEAAFLPHILDDVIDGATVNGAPAVSEKIAIYTSPKDKNRKDPGWPWVKIYMLVMLPLVGLTYWKPRAGLLIIGPLFGLLGVSIALLWFATTYDFVENNVNLAVFPPTHLLLFVAALSFDRFKRHGRSVRIYLSVHLVVIVGLAIAAAAQAIPQAIGPALGLALPVTLIAVVKTRKLGL